MTPHRADRTSLVERDRAHLWHPFTQHGAEADPLAVESARGSLLTLEDGRELIDAISSWWACLHGHSHPRIVAAMTEQVGKLDHVLFAGATHAPAVELGERLVACSPAGLSRVFFSDNGSTAVEVALKMVIQSWVQRDRPERRVFIALEGGYHGDTFGAMAAGDPEPYFRPFEPFLFEVRRVAPTGEAVREAIAELGGRAAGVVLEPLVQGAGGMRMQPPTFLREVRAACDEAGVPWIADEVMCGFGRTGALFACDRAGVAPDLLCLAKGLTGGAFPLSVTLATEAMFETFLSTDRLRAFFHGHTFTANPVGCAVALASLDVCEQERTPERLDAIGGRIEAALKPALQGCAGARDLRRTGGIVAVDLAPPSGESAGYASSLAPRLRALAVERGVLLRPLGNVLYAMPPASTTDEQCDRIAAVMAELALAAAE
ncbi:MAG: adenosylmethionine--8-amino-7-oxononanoate transaminase [Planctomycetota bacterium]|jgi:adenosylmethionine-8-amino-7-oxononanoate aminotransferase|nr:adenosylmethionine--8-amino-7-oxononanoate transaminase [Planctomycetota bacterium]MDP6761233.1 adenosylmethionine--8-amino-7-oxononanoate transaminase [Planctomycetota bacterium]MDP6988373.1 adenosylmethionine--8-amino-7-oxononanoate transaminase [Planctomycetota bacterium]